MGKVREKGVREKEFLCLSWRVCCMYVVKRVCYIYMCVCACVIF